jgi:hypothetical protein
MQASKENVENAKKTIIIRVEGGLIEDIDGIPPDVEVVVRDYDVEMLDEDDLQEDEDGNECIESNYSN